MNIGVIIKNLIDMEEKMAEAKANPKDGKTAQVVRSGELLLLVFPNCYSSNQ